MCSILKIIVDFASFHGVCLPRVKSLWHQFMEQCQLKSVHTNGELIGVHLEGNMPNFGDGCVPRVCLKNEFLNDHCHYNCHLALSPREDPTPAKLPWSLASVFKHEFNFMGYTSHHFEDPYLRTRSDQFENTLEMVRDIQGSTRIVFQFSK